MIRFVCPHCKKPSGADDSAGGRVIACPNCGQRLQLPTASPPLVKPTAADEIPDEDEAKLRAELPGAFSTDTEALGRPRFRVERQVLDQNAYKPAFALVLCCIPCLIGVLAPGVYLLPRLLGILFISAFVTGAVLFVRHQRRKTKAYAVLWTGGFVHFDGGKFNIWRWADIAIINTQAIDQRTLVLFIETDRLLTKFYRLRHRDGSEYQFWNTQGPRAAQFGIKVEQETFRLMMPAAAARLAAGQSVRFDPFEVRPEGLLYREQLTPWADIKPARFENGSLRLDGLGPQNGKVRILLQKINNHHVFLSLLEQKVGFEDKGRR